MNAKDTVIGKEGLNRAYMGNDYHPSFEVRLEMLHGLEMIAKTQAEITWAEAIREVIRYLISPDNGLSIEMHGDKWGKQLKEWGI